MPLRYCDPEDLILGKLHNDDTPRRIKFVNMAADEIDECLGQTFVLPLAPPLPATVFPTHVQNALKRANIYIASGRYLLDSAAAGQVDGVDSYGMYLLQEGRSLLQAMEYGTFDIGAVKITVQSGGDAPMIVQGDSTSGVDAFYAFTSGDPLTFDPYGSYGWRPGITQ